MPVQEKGEVLANTPDESGAAAMRMSPKRLSACTAPSDPRACPPSATRPMSMLAFAAHVWKARQNLALPGRRRPGAGKRLREGALSERCRRTAGRETQREMVRVGPRNAERARHAPVFECLETIEAVRAIHRKSLTQGDGGVGTIPRASDC